MTPWERRRDEVAARIGGRGLVWIGTRGTDAHPLARIGEIRGVFCQIVPPEIPVNFRCLENLTLNRVDLNRYSIDDDVSQAARSFKQALRDELTGPAVVVPYRPLACLASIAFSAPAGVTYCGMFHLQQAAFEHKPWLEEQMRSEHVRTIPWTYVHERQINRVRRALDSGPMVLRSNISDGGAGLTFVRDPSELTELPVGEDGFCAMAPFLEGALPLNLNACVFASGEVSLFPLSLQLIGIPISTSRRFGFSGNDFGAARDLPDEVIEQVEAMSIRIGHRLARNGYVGQFGVDLLWHKGHIYMAEVNPRFQGSTALSSRVSDAQGLPDAYLEHLAAYFGLSPQASAVPYLETVRNQGDLAQLIMYNRSPRPVFLGQVALTPRGETRVLGLPANGLAIDPEGMLFKAIFDRRVTSSGLELLPDAETESIDLFDQATAHATFTR